jgi:hypothetical protein
VWIAAPGDYATLSKVYHLSDGTVGCKVRTVIDLPEDLREAIDTWTCGCRS